MNNKTLVKISNIIGIISIILFVYWVFIFVSIQIFGFKVFRENLTETFYFSVVGILALMAGALIINVMLNLTRIAEKHNQDSMAASRSISKRMGILFAVSFPLIFLLLFGGDFLSSKKKERVLIQSATSIVDNNLLKSDILLNYTFDENWIIESTKILEICSKTDSHFPHVSVITQDKIDEVPVFLGFGFYSGTLSDTIVPKKIDFIRETSQEERDYLYEIFNNQMNHIRFRAHDGRYELFYPFIKDGKVVVLFFSDYQQYGKIGS